MKKESFRATLLCCFLFNGIYSNTLYFVNGFFDHENLRIFFFGFLPAFFGTISGLKLKSFIPEEKFNKIAAVIVIMIGIIGIVRSMMILCTDFDIPDFGK